MAVKVEINDVEMNAEHGSFKIDDHINERTSGSIRINDPDNNLTIKRGHKVKVWDLDDNLLFQGVVARAGRSVRAHKDSGFKRPLDIIDNTYFADKVIVAVSYEEMNTGDIIRDLIDNHEIGEEGVTYTIDSVDDGTFIELAVFNYVSGGQAIDRLAEYSNYYWYIDHDKVLWFKEKSATPAPFGVDAFDMLSVKVEDIGDKYRNKQYIRGIRDTVNVPEETKNGNGSSRTFNLGYRVAQEPTIDVSYDGGSWQSQTVGVKNLHDNRQWYWAYTEETIAQDEDEPVLTGNDQVRVNYSAILDVIVISENSEEVVKRQDVEGQGTGIVSATDEEPELESSSAGFDFANAKLERLAQDNITCEFTTWLSGLKPGHLLSIDLPSHELVDDLLIESIDVEDAGNEIRHTVHAVKGPEIGSWQKFFGRAQEQRTFIVRENIGEDEILSILFTFSKDWTEVDQPGNPMYEVFPSDTLLPSNSLYPMFAYEDRFSHVQVYDDNDQIMLRKAVTERDNLETDEVFTRTFLTPNEANGEVKEITWYGGINATNDTDSGIALVTETLGQNKSDQEQWQIERTDEITQ